MDNRPIGVFDSGMGGLTAVRELAALLPHEQLIYFGDTGRVPYGGRSRNTIIRYARQDVAFLRSFDLKAIVVACGTVSTTALPILQAEAEGFPIFGVVESTARQAADATRNGKIGLIATRASIRTGAYQAVITRLRPEAQVSALACPLFVPLVENGRTQPGDVVIETVAAEYLAPLKAEGVDTLVLGCTHYPLLKEVIRNFMGADVTLIDSGDGAGGAGEPGRGMTRPEMKMEYVSYDRAKGREHMEEKNVMISITGLQKVDGVEQEPVELITPGVLSQVGGGYHLTYRETALTGLEGTITSFQVYPDQVSMVRMGTVCLQMVFEKGRRHLSVYETPYGNMSVGVRTEQLTNTLGESGGVIDIKYALEIDHAFTGRNEFHIEVQEMSSSVTLGGVAKQTPAPVQ